jgi:adenosylcobinamide-GDP ribazoletransferase
MMVDGLRRIATDLEAGLLFSTLLPIPHAAPIEGGQIARASWTLPLVGVLIGLAGAAVYWIVSRLALPGLVSAVLALTATLALTGCLHEDGLADTFDGLGGGATRERKLEIMRDSRIGSYGACALVMSLLLRTAAVASLAEPAAVALALVASHAGARALLPGFMRLLPPARSDGLAADAGRPSRQSVALAVLFGAAALVIGLGIARTLVASMLLVAAFTIVRRLCLSQIGGQTGDVAGALEQIGEVAILLTAAAG